MTQAYSDPDREDDEFSLPDVEVFHMDAEELAGVEILNETDLAYDVAANAGQIFANVKDTMWFRRRVAEELEGGWFWWTCCPGCLPDSEMFGPFESEAEALADARDY